MGNKISQRGMQHYPRHSTSDDDYDNQILEKWFSSLYLEKNRQLQLGAEKSEEILASEGESDKKGSESKSESDK